MSLGTLRLLRSGQDLKNYIVDFIGFKASWHDNKTTGYIHEDELIQFPNQDNGTSAMPGSYNTPLLESEVFELKKEKKKQEYSK